MGISTKITTLDMKNDFPLLMIHRDDLEREDPLIALFVTFNDAMVISTNRGDNFPHINHDMEYMEFVPYHGEITLKNN